MPVIRTFPKVDRSIEDFEEICAPEVYPIFFPIDYIEETAEAEEISEGKEVISDVKNTFFVPSIWKKWLAVLKTKQPIP
ncbi:MAG: hypothetical protein DWQ02_21735 [Bacteroidetes bacterium]|nr:MAG: hypothetical protein DWQ02_21735 [Bacteroidota bacterium]